VATSSIPIIIHSLLVERWPNELSVELTIRNEGVFITPIPVITRFKLLQHLKSIYL
jgi:hypothetical protein